MTVSTNHEFQPIPERSDALAGGLAEVSGGSDVRGEVTPADLLESLLAPVVAAMGYELVHLEWFPSASDRKLQLFIDWAPSMGSSADGASGEPRRFGVEDCARLSPIVSNALDAAEADPQTSHIARILESAYTLEVSSPGLERPLSKRSHFARFVGHRATVRTIAPLRPESKQRTFHGQISGVEPDAMTAANERSGAVVLTADDGDVFRISLALIRRANLVYEG
jgi:ribosome maturation factor RimP